MAKLKLLVADNVTLNRDGTIHRAGDVFEADNDDEITQWLKLGYISKKATRKRAKERVNVPRTRDEGRAASASFSGKPGLRAKKGVGGPEKVSAGPLTLPKRPLTEGTRDERRT